MEPAWEPLKHLTGASKLLKEYLSRPNTKSGCERDANGEAESVIQFDKIDPEQGDYF